MNNILQEAKKKKLRDEFRAVDSFYRTSNGSLNKVSIGLSILIIVMIIALGFFVTYKTSAETIERTVVNSLSEDSFNAQVKQAFLDGLTDYEEGDVAYDDLATYITDQINASLSSTNSFTDSQLEELNTCISDYLSTATIYETVDKNETSITDISSIVNSKYESNLAYIENVESQLQQMIEEQSDTSSAYYQSLVDADANIQLWLDTNTTSLNEKFTTSLNDLSTSVNESIDTNVQNLTDLINELSTLTGTNFDEFDQKLTDTADTINNTIIELDAKYSTSYSKNITISVPGTTTVTGDIFKSYSNINVVYDVTEGYTVDYELSDGQLVITTRQTDGSSVSTISATIYIDNSSVNATEE